MFHCNGCGAVAAADSDSGYDFDELCPRCRQDLEDDIALTDFDEAADYESLDLDREREDEAYEKWRDRE